MAQPRPLQTDFDVGFVRDLSRDGLPPGAMWDLKDFFPDVLGYPLRKRGGWSHGSDALTGGSGTRTEMVAYADLGITEKLFAISDSGSLWKINQGTNAMTFVGAANYPQGPIHAHRGKLIIPGSAGTAPKKYDGTTLAALGGTPPNAQYVVVYKDRVVLLRTDTDKNIAWFSAAGDSESWPTTSFFRHDAPILGAGVTPGAILVFTEAGVERLRGNTPPPNTDMARDFAFDVGLIDAKSIVQYEDTVIWADPHGIYRSDGASLDDLAERAGISRYWGERVASISGTIRVSAGVYRDHLFVSLWNATGPTFVDGFAINLVTYAPVRIDNLKAASFVGNFGGAEELYFGRFDALRVGEISSMFSPAAGVKNDADGTAVLPSAESPYYTAKLGKQAWKEIYLSYDLRDAASDNPILTASFVTSPESTSYTAMSPTVAESSARVRERIPVSRTVEGVGFKVAQTNPSAETIIYALEGVFSDLEGSR